MSKSVLDKVRDKCRKALKAHIPVVYIKTDSSIFIHNLLMSSPALVTRLWSSEEYPNKNNCIIQADEDFKFSDIDNYTHEMESKSVDPLDKRDEPTNPFIKAYKVKREQPYVKLKEYIMRHENPTDECYGVFQNSLIILYSLEVYLDSSLLPYVDIIELGYPDEDEIKETVVRESDSFFDSDDADDFSNMLLGLSAEDVTMLTRRLVALSSNDMKKINKTIYEYKSQKMEGGYLELCKVDDSELGGMDLFTEWLDKKKNPLISWYKHKKRLGNMPPRGVLLTGIPGCGKSAAANYIASTLGLPLIRMDIGNLMSKYQGEAERKMRESLKLAEQMSPCILWLDEIEKGFSGASGDSEDSSSFKKMFATLLGWMQEHEKPCFIIATANNIGGLPKEFFRSGRFDELFAIYVPSEEDCISIFKAIMSKKEKKSERKEIFEKDCMKDGLYEDVIKKTLIKNGKPRIVIGSDIEKAIGIALTELVEKEIIDDTSWKDELIKAFNECTVYGDSEENLESVAVSYCRLLRKGMKSTTKNVLFKPDNYHINNYDKLRDIKAQKSTMEDDEYNKLIEENSILQIAKCCLLSDYDNLVYEVLKEKINAFAFDVEEYERAQLVRK